MDQTAEFLQHDKHASTPSMFASGGEMGARMRATDWSITPLGAPETWPQSLRSAVSICLNSRFPIAIYWGTQFALLYNDAWSPILGEKHPWALGRSGHEVWPEIWPEIGPLFDQVYQTGEGVWQQDQLLPMYRHGYTEECYFNFTFSPIHGEDGSVAGVFNAVIETTFRVIEERHAGVLRELADQTAGATTVAEVFVRAAHVLHASTIDAPFGLFYLRENAGAPFQLAATAGVTLPEQLRPPTLVPVDTRGAWPETMAVQSARTTLIDQLGERFGVVLPSGVWPEAVDRAAIAPLTGAQASEPIALLILGISPRRVFDDAYRTFIERIATQVTAAVNNALLFEAERQRAAKLAEIDQAKTTFFSNVSHEFRTPLTLLLGPLEDLLQQTDGTLLTVEREQIDIAHRNGLRLLKLVNTLLDFSRIEAGRVETVYAPTDLAVFTADLASVFRSAVERVGLRLIVDCPPLPDEVYVDHDMWEKIVFNLLSNALKFTFAGEIEVSLRQAGTMAELAVRDTGTGIPATELPHLFERFHRVQGARGRTFEGSGIGLALVYELVKLHGGTVRVESEIDRGTTFTVSIPTGTAHLPAERIGATPTLASTSVRGEVYVEEALRWLPAPQDGNQDATRDLSSDSRALAQIDSSMALSSIARRPTFEARPAILLADDNADMREYVGRLLRERYDVVAVADGMAALQAAHERPPDLILTDVMMPKLDGFGLLHALRTDERTRETLVILLSARAGEEARVEGLEAGADDYLVKPFSARELLARVETHIELQRVRREGQAALRASEEKFAAAFNQSPLALTITAIDDGRLIEVNDSFLRLTGYTRDEVLGRTPEALHLWVDAAQRNQGLTKLRTHGRIASVEARFRLKSGNEGIGMISASVITVDGRPHVLSSIADITARKLAEEALQESEARARLALQIAQLGAWRLDLGAQLAELDAQMCVILNLPPGTKQIPFSKLAEYIHPDNRAWLGDAMAGTLDLTVSDTYALEYRIVWSDGTEHWLSVNGQTQFEGEGTTRKAVGVVGTALDITERKQAEVDARILAALGDTIRYANDADQLLGTACALIATHFGASHCAWAQVDNERGTATIDHEYREPPSNSMLGSYFLADYPPEWIRTLRQGQTWAINDLQAYVSTAGNRDVELWDDCCHALFQQPVLSDNVWVGTLIVHYSSPRHWTQREISLFETIAERVWNAFEKLRLAANQRDYAARLQQLNAASLALNAAATRDEMQRLLTDAARTLIDAHQAHTSVLTNNDWAQAVTHVSLSDTYAATSNDRPTLQRPELDALVRQMNTPLRMTHAELVSHPQWNVSDKEADTQPSLRGLLAAPLVGRNGRTMGLIQLFDKIKGEFTADDQAILVQLAQVAAVALENRALYEQEQAARTMAEEANRLKDEFLATVSHELRTPLTSILGYGQLLQLRKRDEAYIERTIDKIMQSAKIQMQLVEDLLDVSRIVSGKLRLETQPIDLITIIHAALDTVRPSIEAKDLRILAELNPDASTMIGDPNRLQQVVWNLLSNAVKFTPSGGTIHVRLRADDHALQLTVRDTGRGISAEFLPYVFDRFRQANSTSTRDYGGLGLGLAIVRHLVELHGGTVQATSAGEGAGATFTIQFPFRTNKHLEEDAVFEPAHAMLEYPPELRGLRVLLVDDQADILEMLTEVLVACGALVQACPNAQAALDTLRTWRPDVLVSDVAMPGEDGYWLLQRVRALSPEEGGATPAIALTAYVRMEEYAHVLTAGFQRYVSKPVEPSELRAAIANLVGAAKGK